jgi:hypothetical protein
MFVADRKHVPNQASHGGEAMSPTQTGNLAVPGADLRYVAIEPRLLISGTPADPGGVALLGRLLARRSVGVAHDARSHVKT